jgi:hypothetical protein
MKNNQTAVEYLIESIIKYGLVPQGTHPDNVLFHKAKEIEKQQHQETATHFFPTSLKKDDFEQYYKDTYEK